jgi:PAS domain S-box-containing protein
MTSKTNDKDAASPDNGCASANRELHTLQAKCELLLRYANDIILLFDAESRLVEANDRAVEVYGYSRAELAGMPAMNLSAPAFHDKLMINWEQSALLDGVLFETVHQRKDGSVFPVEVSMRLMEIDGRSFCQEIVRDISERTAQQEKIRQQLVELDNIRKEWITVFDSVSDPICIHDRDMRIVRANRAYADKAGLPFKQIIGQFYWQIFPKLDVPLHEFADPGDEGHVIRLANGEIYDSHCYHVRNEQGEDVYTIHIMEDVTERERAEQSLRRISRTLATLSAGNRALVHAASEAELLEEICNIAVSEGGYAMAWVGYVQQDVTQSIIPVAHAGSEHGYLGTLNISLTDSERSDGPVGRAVRFSATQIIQNIQTDPSMTPWRESAAKRGYNACIALPLQIGGKVFGVLAIYAAATERFIPEEITLLEEMADDMSFGIASRRTQIERDDALQKYLEKSEQLLANLNGTIRAIAATVEVRDPYTAGHQNRVADLAVAIAQELGLDADRIYGLHLAGVVHDLGKIQIPAEILSKPGRLTDIEYAMIKQHPQSGYDILKGIQFPWPIAQIVLQHHERLDGSGYPNGLKDKEILLEAKILAVADVVEAMASHRPYRAGLGMDAALDEIAKNKGRLYDTAAVDACIRLFHEEKFAFVW